MNRSEPDRRWFAGIQNRLVIAFLTVAILPVVVLAIYGAQSQLKALAELAFDTAADQAQLRARKLQSALSAAQNDLSYLQQMPSLALSGDRPSAATDRDSPVASERMTKQFETFVASRGTYRSVAYIDSTGRERVRVDRRGMTTWPLPPDELAERPPHEDLVYRGEHLLAGQTLTEVVSDEGGPMVRFVTRLFPRGLERRGFVVLEARLKTLVGDEETDGGSERLVLFNQAREVILGDPDAISSETLSALIHQPRRPMEIEHGRVATLVPIEPNRANRAERWFYVTLEPRAAVLGSLTRFRYVFTVVLIGTLVLAASISVLLARQFTVPLKRLYAAAQDIGHGRYDVPLEDETGDEIGGLAHELRAMADKLRIKHEDMQQQIDEKTLELLQAERLSTIGTMSAAIAHEVNNPLGVISMYSQMLLEQFDPEDPRARKLRMIAREASRMSVLVRGLLQFARRPELNLTQVDLAAMTREAVSAAADLQEESHGLDIVVDMSDDCPSIEADADQLGQVIRNLAVNAFHAMNGKGRLTVTARPFEADHVRIQVADTGHGIEPDHLSKLFEPFFTTRRFGAGTGLGLSISKEIVERHGGTISVESQVGEGTTFTITLPRRQSAGEETQPAAHTGSERT